MRDKDYMRLITLWLLFALSFSVFLGRVDSVEYIYLRAGGESMAPTISAGQTVKVKIGYNGTDITAGLPNSSTPGDLIVYGSIAALSHIPQPQSMWICHRVVEKYVKDGTWYFYTKGDNNPQIDPWEVPGYFVLGVVVEIGCINPTDSRQESQTMRSFEPTISLSALGDLAVGIVIGLTVGTIILKIRNI